MDLHRRQAQLRDDVGVLDRQRLINGLALQPFSGEARAGDRRAAPERLELGVVDDTGLGVDLDLQLHHVAAFRSAHQPGADVRILFRQRADVARVLVVIDYFARVSHLALQICNLNSDACNLQSAICNLQSEISVSELPTASSTNPRPLSRARRAATSRAAW